MTIDTVECLKNGTIGACGAVPGTLLAHPLDLTKIRMQLQPNLTFRAAMRQTLQNPLAGVTSGISQKILTRGPMFFTSELCTQVCQRYGGLERHKAVCVGSFGSGFLTGFLASPAEWAKVQQGTQERRKRGTHRGAFKLVASSINAGHGACVLRRMRGAGLRNGVFDSTFFGTEHFFSSTCQMPHSISFALAATLAVIVDYPVDVAVKRSMAKSKGEIVRHGPIMATIQLVLVDCGGSLRKVYNGIGCKGGEFAVSYFVTGAIAPTVLVGFGAFVATASSYSLWPWPDP